MVPLRDAPVDARRKRCIFAARLAAGLDVRGLDERPEEQQDAARGRG